MYTSYLYLLECPTLRQKQCYSLEQNKMKRNPSIPCCLAVTVGTACTPSLSSSSSAPCAWSNFYGGTWVGSVPSSVCTARGLWTAPVWSSASDVTSRGAEASGKTDHQNVILERSHATCPVCAKTTSDSHPQLQVEPWRSNPERFVSVRWSRTRMENIFMGHEYSQYSVKFGSKLRSCARSGPAQSCITTSFSNTSAYLDVVDWVNVLHRVHHHFADLSRKEPRLTKLGLLYVFFCVFCFK